jgi:predicted DNA-binding transcriptional regulator AlpA
MNDIPKEWLSVEDLAEWFGVEVRAIYNMNYNGTAPPRHRIAGKLRYRRSELLAWTESRRVEPRSA